MPYSDDEQAQVRMQVHMQVHSGETLFQEARAEETAFLSLGLLLLLRLLLLFFSSVPSLSLWKMVSFNLN